MVQPTLPAPSRKPIASERAAGVVRVGERTVLRFANSNDAREFLALLERSREHLAPWMPRAARASEPTLARKFARMLPPECNTPSKLRVLVCARDADAAGPAGRMVGVVSLSNISEWPQLAATTGYWLGAGETGKGFMRDALASMLDIAFEEKKLHRVVANILPANRRSHAVVEALGFTKEGIARGLVEIDGAWRDHTVWSILSTEWRDGKLDRTGTVGARRTVQARSARVEPPKAR
jgi:ribosomal-protein-alanine N-acetyltransferase